MRWTFALLLVCAFLLPWLALNPSTQASKSTTIALPPGHYEHRWLVLSPTDGLHLSVDDGRRWLSPQGLPRRGSLYSVVADPSRPGVAYASNGDVYRTADGGATWQQLPPVRSDPGPAGITALASDPHTHILYAAGAGIHAFVPGRRVWIEWGRGWPAGAVPSALLAGGHGDLYAAAGSLIYYASGAETSWRALSSAALDSTRVGAMALGPDGATPIVATRGRGIWYIDRSGTLHPLGDAFPPGATIAALAPDPGGTDVYVATSAGLYAHDQQNLTAGSPGNAWRLVLPASNDAVVSLLPAGRDLLAVTAGGVVYSGTHLHWQTLAWPPASRRVLRGIPLLDGALSGAQWQALPSTPPESLPEPFTRPCLPIGPGPGQTFDVCGPFLSFYLQFRYPVLGWPRERAVEARRGLVEQRFENVVLRWTQQQGVFLAALGQRAAGGQTFPHPSPRALSQNNTAVWNGYYVDPIFYPFWREHQYHDASIFGPPISQVVQRPSTDGTGDVVKVQYFRYARLEYHTTGVPIRVSSLGAQ